MTDDINRELLIPDREHSSLHVGRHTPSDLDADVRSVGVVVIEDRGEGSDALIP